MSDDGGFILDLRSTNGSVAVTLPEAEDQLPIHEWSTWLRIRSDITGFVPPTYNPEDDELTGFVPPVFERDGLALLTTVRNNADLPGSVGLFHARLTAEELDELRAAVEGTAWAQLPRPVGGDYNAPQLELAYERGGLMIRRGFNARSGNFIEAILPVLERLEGYIDRARKSPASSLELTIAAEPGAEEEALERNLKLTLRVRGIGHVALTDPRVPPATGQAPRLRVRVGQLVSENPHARPQGRVELPIPPLPEGAAPSRVLRPHARLSVEIPWTAPGPGRYRVEASWQDYGGPLEAAPGQTPFMPLSATGASSLGSGPYPVRGALFAVHELELP